MPSARRAGNTVLNSTFNNVIECFRGTTGNGEGSAEFTDTQGFVPAPGFLAQEAGRGRKDTQWLPSLVTDAEKCSRRLGRAF